MGQLNYADCLRKKGLVSEHFSVAGKVIRIPRSSNLVFACEFGSSAESCILFLAPVYLFRGMIVEKIRRIS